MTEPMIRGLIFSGLLLLFAAWERGAPKRPLSVGRKRWIGNLGVIAFSTLFVRLAVPLAPVAAAVLASEKSWGLFSALALPIWLEGLLTFLALDLLIYWQHRAFHAIPMLWRLHRMHHTDLDLDVTSGLRFHPLEIALSLLLKTAAVLALGPPALAVLLFEIVLNATSMFNHANIALAERLDRALRRIVVTPDMHRVHHSIDKAETDSNFGFNLPWWDWLFATYRAQPEAGHLHMTIGLETFRDKRAWRLDQLLIQPFVSKP